MARYEYIGPGPREDAESGLIRPGDEREFDEEPAFGPWREIVEEAEDDAEEAAAPTPAATPTPAPAPAPTLTAPPVKGF